MAIYFVQLLLGVFVAVFSYQQLNGAIGNSLELDRLANGFDRSIFSDMVNKFPQIIGLVQGRFGLGILLFLMISVFLHAGLLGNIRKHEYQIKHFLRNAKKHFFRFTGIALISILQTIVILAIIWVPFTMWLGNPLEAFRTEKILILTLVGLIVLSILLIIIIWLWSVLTRYQLADGADFVPAMKAGWRELRANFKQYFLTGIGLILLHVIITWFYTLLVDDWGAETWFCVIGLISIQQIFSIVRVWLRAFAYTTIND